MRYLVGDKVEVEDTSNGRTLEGIVRQTKDREGKVEVYMLRFKNSMEFIRGVTARGRFKLVGKVNADA
jgi:hypothetical protein